MMREAISPFRLYLGKTADNSLRTASRVVGGRAMEGYVIHESLIACFLAKTGQSYTLGITYVSVRTKV